MRLYIKCGILYQLPDPEALVFDICTNRPEFNEVFVRTAFLAIIREGLSNDVNAFNELMTMMHSDGILDDVPTDICIDELLDGLRGYLDSACRITADGVQLPKPWEWGLTEIEPSGEE